MLAGLIPQCVLERNWTKDATSFTSVWDFPANISSLHTLSEFCKSLLELCSPSESLVIVSLYLHNTHVYVVTFHNEKKSIKKTLYQLATCDIWWSPTGLNSFHSGDVWVDGCSVVYQKISCQLEWSIFTPEAWMKDTNKLIWKHKTCCFFNKKSIY